MLWQECNNEFVISQNMVEAKMNDQILVIENIYHKAEKQAMHKMWKGASEWSLNWKAS